MNRGTRRLVQIGTGAVLGLVVAGLVSWPVLRPDDGLPMAEAPYRVGFDIPLLSMDGATTSLGELEPGWTLLFFGFTHCPDVCPVTLQRLAAGLTELERRGTTPDAPVRVALVTVDPARDTPTVIGDYLEPFGSRFVGFTGEPSHLAELADGYGVIVQEPQPADPSNEDEEHGSGMHGMAPTGAEGSEIAHTARVFVLDPEGRWIDEIPPWPGANDMADALAAVMGVAVPS